MTIKANREPCFFTEEDYHCHLHWLRRSTADWRCAVHVYVLIAPMTAQGLTKLMHSLGRRYVQYVNRSYRRTGSLWEGRFNSSAV